RRFRLRQAGRVLLHVGRRRKRSFDIAVEELGGHRTILSCSDQNLDTVIDLAKHAQAIGADYIVVHAPVLHFSHKQDDTLYQYYQTISEQLEIGIELWSHPDSGYLMSPELCARVAGIPNVVAIKYSVPRDMYARLTRLAGDTILVSTASEEEWFDNIVELGWRLYLCSAPPYLACCRARRIGACAHTTIWPSTARARAPRPCATVSIRCARRFGARGRRKNSMTTRSAGRSCWGRPAARCAGRCSSSRRRKGTPRGARSEHSSAA